MAQAAEAGSAPTNLSPSSLPFASLVIHHAAQSQAGAEASAVASNRGPAAGEGAAAAAEVQKGRKPTAQTSASASMDQRVAQCATVAVRAGTRAAVIKITPLDLLRMNMARACLHGGPTGSYGIDGHLTEADYRELYDCCSSCIERVHPGPWPWPRPTASHACTHECVHVCHKDTFVCCVSGFVHHCTQYTCEYAIVPPGGHSKVCPITCNSYACDFEYSFEQTGHADGQHKRDTRVTVNKKPTKDYLACASSPSPSPTSSCGSPSPRASGGGKRRAVAAPPVQERYLVVASHINKFTCVPLEQSVRERLALEILDLMRQIDSTGVPAPPSWTLESATLTILYSFTKASLTMGSLVWTRFHPELLNSLKPLRDCMTSVLKCPYKSHTIWLSYLGTTMAAYYHQREQAEQDERIRQAKPTTIVTTPTIG